MELLIGTFRQFLTDFSARDMIMAAYNRFTFCLLCWGLTTSQPLWVILCRLPEKGRKEIEEIVEEMKERDK